MKLKPWYNVVTPREDLREGKPLDASEFAVHLEKVRDGNAPKDYQDPRQFFEKTFLTRNLLDLATQVVRRLNGVKTETSAIFNLATQFGGGKTHSLTLLYHLFHHGPDSHGWMGVGKILQKSGQREVPKSKVAIFVGTEFDSLEGRGGEDGTPHRKTPWGEIAFQLGGEKAFKVVAKHDEQGTAPGGDVLAKLLPADEPCLILMDELMNYISRNRKTGLSDQFYNFVQNLTETARGLGKTVVAVSIPASEMEMSVKDTEDYNRITKLIDRLGKALVMSAESETSEIIRRRLFEWEPGWFNKEERILLPPEAKKTCQEYGQWVIDHKAQLPGWFASDQAQKQIEDTYPFHPTVLSVFERKWRGVPKFQQTRGILRLLALWVSRAFKDGFQNLHRDPLITLGTAPLDEPTFRSACFEQLGERNLETAVTTDISGGTNSHSIKLDQTATPAIKKERLHQKIAVSIFFESNGGQLKGKEATEPEVRLAVGGPELDLGNIETAIEALVEDCYYLTREGKTYRFSLRENLNKRYADRRATIAAQSVTDRIKKEIQKIFTSREKVDRVFFPEKSIQISDRPSLTFVIADYTQSLADKGTIPFIAGMVRDSGASGRTFKAGQIWIVADSPDAMRDEAIKVLAWEDIERESGSLNLEEAQKKSLRESSLKAARDLKETIWRSYKTLVFLDPDNKIITVDLGLINSSAGATPIDLVLQRLLQDGIMEKSIGANFLVRNWPPAFVEWSTRNLRDSFFASPRFPKLLNPDSLKETIARGVARGEVAYLGKSNKGRYEPFYFKKEISPADVEISEEMFIVSSRTAEDYLANQAPAPLISRPAEGGAPESRAHTTFTSEIPPRGPESSGVNPVPPPDSHAAGETTPDAVKIISWSGTIPHQKWMNFYTKILSSFALDKTLKLHIKFEVSPDGGIPRTKVDEIRAALRDFGLGELGIEEDCHRGK